MEDHGTSAKIFKTIFHGLDNETLHKLFHVAQEKSYPADVVLCHQGAIEDTFYVVVSGEVVVTQTLEDGQKRILGRCIPNQFFGEMGLLDQTPRIADCMTIQPTTVLELTQDMFQDLVNNNPAVAYALMYRFLENLRANDSLAIQELLTKNEELARAYQELQIAQLELIRKERLERELEIAAEVQHSLLPQTLPTVDGLDFAAHLEFSRSTGGDFYDVMRLDDDHVGVLLGDVADKGIHASLFMAVTRTLFLSESKRSLSPAEVTRCVQRGMLDMSANNDMFVMAFYGVIHRPSGRLTYIIAGHQQPLIARANGIIEGLEGRGSFLGMFESIELHEYQATLQAGDRLILFSNGVTDAMNSQGKPYGPEHLIDTIKSASSTNATELVDTIMQDIKAWCRDNSLIDDVALLIVDVK